MTLHQLPCCTILLHCLPANWYGNCCAKIGICHGVFFKDVLLRTDLLWLTGCDWFVSFPLLSSDGTTRNPPAPRSFNSLLWKKLRVTAGAAYKTRYTYSTLKVWLIMGEPLLENSILDQFINSHEQSYEEFLNTFTYLLKGSLVLPGEVEETVSCCTPFFDKPIQPKFRAWSVPQPSDSKAQEAECLFEDTSTRSNAEMQYSMSTKHILANALLGDDVQPFSLDEEFDYDNVALTPKFSEAELKSIIELSEEKMGTDVKSARAED
ncbi:intraflagellar transport-associated protein isoform X7 [Passer montanus]|uniref:intraflagellar transport-associated protein isoform X7 n=1 Tax=Passer montanus TaxID=9160 RepID=UPI001961C979|nr:intraflagellar transport-associated protein isoform X7 [Passer montanus]